VRRLVEEARADNVRLAVATTTSRPNIDLLLRLNFPGDAQPFDVIAAGDEAAQKEHRQAGGERRADAGRRILESDRLGGIDAETVDGEREDIRGGLLLRRLVAGGDHVEGLRVAPVLATRSRYTQSHRLDGAFSAVSDLGEPDAPHQHLQGHAWPDGVVTLDGTAPFRDPRPGAEGGRPDRPRRGELGSGGSVTRAR
jgi:hypothetical protein